MADGMPTPAGMGAGGQPPAPAGAPSQPPPTGASPATMPVANRGEQAAGMGYLAVAVNVLEQALPLLGMGTEAGREVHASLPKLAKHASPGTVSEGVKNRIIEKLYLASRQNSMNVASMRGGGQPPGGPPGAAPGMPPPAPRPAPPPGMGAAA